jgi:cation diffusion facilitator family transporter
LKHGSKKVVLAAFAGNLIITVIKFIVAAITLSAAMLAEAIHSLADTGNQVLLLLGLRRSTKPADEAHPFGYGAEQYFWSFVVAIMLFFVGAVVSIYEGIGKLLEPHPIEKAWLIYIILGAAFLLESCALCIAWREFGKTRPPGAGVLASIIRSKDTNVVVVLLEDSAALAGLLIAFGGVVASELTGMAAFDAVASIAIGLLLALVAFVLAREVKELLIGESAGRIDRRAIAQTLATFVEIQAVGAVRTLQLAPDRILVAMDLEFADDLNTDAIEQLVGRIETAIRGRVPAADRIYIEAAQIHKTTIT